MILHARKGLSNVIAVMMLILISISGAMLLYVYASGLMGSLQGGAPQQGYMDQLSLEFYDWTNTAALKLQIRNVGATNVVVVDIFMSGTKVTSVNWGACPNGSISVQASCLITLTPPASVQLQPGVAYSIVFVTSTGGKANFSAIDAQSS